ncbi:hypothetical protein TNCV_4935591 [Trichonephila clavipes]|nr:hypothetical protein TNCV_4935591 [Trichonephila clavipes]
MAASSSSFIPTPLAHHADNERVGHSRGVPLHSRQYGTINHHRTWGRTSRVNGVSCKNSYKGCDVERNERRQ